MARRGKAMGKDKGYAKARGSFGAKPWLEDALGTKPWLEKARPWLEDAFEAKRGKASHRVL
jgi:hypothetical protein